MASLLYKPMCFTFKLFLAQDPKILQYDMAISYTKQATSGLVICQNRGISIATTIMASFLDLVSNNII